MSTYGGNFRQLREKQRLSQQDIADYLGISQSTVSLWESDKTTPQVEYLPKLAEILKVFIMDLIPKNTLGQITVHTNSNDNAINDFGVKIDTSQLFKDLLDSKDEIIRLQREEIQRLKSDSTP